MKKHIVGLTGKQGAGKDTVAHHLVKEYGYERIGFADEVKIALLRLNPVIYFDEDPTNQFSLRDAEAWYEWDFLKRNTNLRGLLQRMGTEVGREMFGKDVWLNKAIDKINASDTTHYVITDVRFDNEAKMIIDNDGLVFKIENPFLPVEDKENVHSSEKGVGSHFIAHTLFNHGLENIKYIADYIHGSVIHQHAKHS